jgi:hypothetical protein
MLALGTEPEMAAIEEEIRPWSGLVGALLGYGIILNGLKDFDTRDAQLVTAWGTVILLDHTLDNDAGLSAESGTGIEGLVVNVPLTDDALREAGPVTEDEEMDLALGAAVVEPAADLNGLSNVVRQICDIDLTHHELQRQG